MRVLGIWTPPLMLILSPTAVQAAAETQDTPSRKLPPVPGLRLGTTDQRVPFQDSTRVLLTPLLTWGPAAMQAAETQDTLSR